MSFYHPIPEDELPPRGFSSKRSLTKKKREKSEPPGPPSPCPEPSHAPAPPPPQDWKLPTPSEDRSVSPAPSPLQDECSDNKGTTESRIDVELYLLEDSIKRAFILDDEGNVSLGSLRQVEKAEKRMRAWYESTSDEGWGYVIELHFEALSMMMKAFKGYYFGLEEDYFVIYSLFQSSIFAFWVAMQSFQIYRPKRKQINPRDVTDLDLPKEFQDCRNNLAHQNDHQPTLVELAECTGIAYAWYTRNFWPNLWFEEEKTDDGSLNWWLTLDMNFPKLDINDEVDCLKLDEAELFDVLAEEGFPEPDY